MCNQVYKDLLVSHLYDDINDMDRAKVDMHLRACEECRAELDALRGVRVDLGSWAPPLPDLGFRIVRETPPTRNAAVMSARTSDEDLIKRVREMIARSEMKQQGELVLRIAQVINAFDAQRTGDLARIQANLTNLQGTVTKEAAAHVDL